MASNLDNKTKQKVRDSLVNFNIIELENLKLDKDLIKKILVFQKCRGIPSDVLTELGNRIGEHDVLKKLRRLFSMIEPIAKKHGINLQLDPTFQPHFELYTGIVFQLICKGISAPVVIARGGRYDELVQLFNSTNIKASGLGFSFAIDKIRELQFELKETKSKYDSAILELTEIKNDLSTLSPPPCP